MGGGLVLGGLGIPPESNLRRKMVDSLRGEVYMEALSLDKRSQPKSGSGH